MIMVFIVILDEPLGLRRLSLPNYPVTFETLVYAFLLHRPKVHTVPKKFYEALMLLARRFLRIAANPNFAKDETDGAELRVRFRDRRKSNKLPVARQIVGGVSHSRKFCRRH